MFCLAASIHFFKLSPGVGIIENLLPSLVGGNASKVFDFFITVRKLFQIMHNYEKSSLFLSRLPSGTQRGLPMVYRLSAILSGNRKLGVNWKLVSSS